MYLEEIITLLRQQLPNFSDSFTEKVTISSITFAAGTVTVVTSSAHGLVDNQVVNIVGAQQRTPISDITTVDELATAITSIDHDLTLDYEDESDQPQITIAGTGIAAYDAAQTLDDVRSRRVFDFAVSGSPAQANTGYLLEDSPTGFSGIKTITYVDTTTFTFTTTQSLATTGNGGYVHYTFRISGDVDVENLLQAYSKQNSDNYWIFAVPKDAAASKSRHTQNDTTATITSGDDFRQRLNQPFALYLFIPTSSKLSGRLAYDNAINESVGIFKSILGAKIPNPYFIESFAKVILEGHGFFTYTKAYYVHEFDFSFPLDLVGDDTLDLKDSVAFRDTEVYNINDNGETIIETLINLDEEETP